MEILITGASAEGETELDAYDAALGKVGLENFNLIPLSSVIPPGANLKRVERCDPNVIGEWGDRLTIVQAHISTQTHNQQVATGLGWVQAADGRGLLCEHEEFSLKLVELKIARTMQSMRARRGLQDSEIQTITNSAVCVGRPVASLCVAVFKSEPW